MKFGLKTFLFGVCGVGAFVGIMGKLLIESPETFVSVLTLLSTVVPFVLAIGTIFYLGLRRERRPKLVAWGVFLLCMPLTVVLFQMIFLPTGQPMRLLSTRRLIERRLPQQVEEPWVWQELERRMTGGRLTAEDATDAFDTLTEHAKTARSGGTMPGLPWQGNFLSKAITAKLVSDETVVKLCDALFGAQPKLTLNGPVSAWDNAIPVQVSYGNPFMAHSGMGIVLLWNVTKVELDGKPLKIKQANRFAQQWNAYLDERLPPGDHELKVDLECAYVDESAVMAMTQGERAPPSQWPKAKKRWTTTLTTPVKVEGDAK